MKTKLIFVLSETLITGVLFSPVIAHSSQWTLGQFPSLAPVITFETGSTALPGIPGLQLSGGDATFIYNNEGFGHQIFGNFNGSTYLDISFSQPQQAVGAYIINDEPGGGVTGVTEVVYDQSNNILESASQSFPPIGYPPVFLGIGETTTNIHKVEWQYIGSGYFGVDNVIYTPGPAIILTNIQASAGQLTFSFQTIPGHTNTIQMSTNLSSKNWTNLTSVLGAGGNMQMKVGTTNAPVGFLRVQVQ